jgi:hypothetical protein
MSTLTKALAFFLYLAILMTIVAGLGLYERLRKIRRDAPDEED